MLWCILDFRFDDSEWFTHTGLKWNDPFFSHDFQRALVEYKKSTIIGYAFVAVVVVVVAVVEWRCLENCFIIYGHLTYYYFAYESVHSFKHTD